MAVPTADEGQTSTVPLVLDDERTSWLTALYEANARMVFRICQRLLDSPEDAADATQEVFIRAAAALHTPPDGKDARAWLSTVARNYSLDVRRRQKRMQTALTTLGAGMSQLESQTEVVDRHLAQAVLEQLAVRERRALWESHVEDRPVAEIAERLGLSYAAAAQLLHRARRRAAVLAAELAALLALIRLGLRRARSSMPHVAQPIVAIGLAPLAAVVVITVAGTPPTYRAQASATPPPRGGSAGSGTPHASAPPVPGVTPSPVPSPSAAPAPAPVAVAPLPVAPVVAPVPQPAPPPVTPTWKKHHKPKHHGLGPKPH